MLGVLHFNGFTLLMIQTLHSRFFKKIGVMCLDYAEEFREYTCIMQVHISMGADK